MLDYTVKEAVDMPREGMLVPERDLKGCESPEQLLRALFRPRRAGKSVAADKPLVRKAAAKKAAHD